MEIQHQGRREIRGPLAKRGHLGRHLPSDGGPNPRKSQLPSLAHTSLECQLHLVVTVFLSPSGVRGETEARGDTLSQCPWGFGRRVTKEIPEVHKNNTFF